MDVFFVKLNVWGRIGTVLISAESEDTALEVLKQSLESAAEKGHKNSVPSYLLRSIDWDDPDLNYRLCLTKVENFRPTTPMRGVFPLGEW